MYLLLCFSEEYVPIKKLRESAYTKARTVCITSKAVTTFLSAIAEKLNCKLIAHFFSEWWYYEHAGVADEKQQWRAVL